ncbi:MAG TPA: hypothetical protein PK922_12940 [Syntrophorhabdus sp.]|nr:hypothetical protein [Syntrophorhabdus sp.]
MNWGKYILPDKMDEFMFHEGDTILFSPLLDGDWYLKTIAGIALFSQGQN